MESKKLLFLLLFFISVGLLGQDLHTQSNAVSASNESNSTAGWSGLATLTTEGVDTQSGSFSFRAVSTANDGRTLDYSFAAVVGQDYTIRIWAKYGPRVGNNTSGAFAVWSGLSGFETTPIAGTQWTEYVFNVTATSANPMIRVYTSNYASRFTAGNTILIDNVSILPVGVAGDTQSPTVPTNLTASGTTTTTTNLSWNASTDNVGVTGYTILQDGINVGTTNGVTSYNVTGLAQNTSYIFTVTASDAAGNVSSASNTANVTTTGGGGGVVDYTSDNSNLTTVDWMARDLFADRNVGIGTTNTQGYRLAVAGSVVAEEVNVKLQVNWPDYVFEKTYNLPSLKEVEDHIKERGYLLNMPSASEVGQNGIDLGQMNAKLLRKIEELTLYTIQQEKKIKILEVENKRIDSIAQKLEKLEAAIKEDK